MSLKETNEGYTRGFGKKKGKLIFNLKKKQRPIPILCTQGWGSFTM